MQGHIKELRFDLASKEQPQTDLGFRKIIDEQYAEWPEAGW